MQLRDSALTVPAARTIDLVTKESNGEVLVYDQAIHHIHHLNAAATKVWRLCDGERTVSEIAAEAGVAENAVKLALHTLEDAQLLDGPLVSAMRGTQSRRSFMKKVAIAGSVPAIVSITAPIAAAAASCSAAVSCKDEGVSNGSYCCESGRTGTCQGNTCVADA